MCIRDRDNTVILVTGDHGEKIPENDLENRVEFLKKSLSKGDPGKASSPWVRARRKGLASLRAGWVRGARLLYHAGLVDSPLATVTGHRCV